MKILTSSSLLVYENRNSIRTINYRVMPKSKTVQIEKKLLEDKELLEYYKKKAAERGSFFSKEKTVAAVEKMLDEI